jgi:hypothetical protein
MLGAVACFLVVGCATYKEELWRAQRAYEASEDERAIAIFRNLEPDLDHLNDSEQAHYAFLRGMTDYRVGYKSESRHWLAIAAAFEQHTPGSLPPDWSKKLGETLKELNEEVYTGGIESLTNTAVAKAKPHEDDVPPDSQSEKTRPSMPPKAD